MRRENNSDSLLSAQGDVFNAQGDVFNAKGDVFNSTGDIFNAQGDVFNAKGDVFNAKGDVFNADGPTGEPGSDEWLAYYKVRPYDEEYYAWIDGTSEEAPTKGSKVFNFLNSLIDTTGKGVDVYQKIKTGVNTDMDGYNAKTNLGDPGAKKNNTMWYVAGGAVVLLIIVGIVVSKRKK